MNKSTQFLIEMQNELIINDFILTNIHIFNILELIKYNRFDDLQAYINDDYGLTPNKNYTYSLRDKISSEIAHNIKYIQEIENNN